MKAIFIRFLVIIVNIVLEGASLEVLKGLDNYSNTSRVFSIIVIKVSSFLRFVNNGFVTLK